MNMSLNKGIVSVVNVHSVSLPDEASVVWCGGSSLANQQSWKVVHYVSFDKELT